MHSQMQCILAIRKWIKYSLFEFYKFQKYNVDQNKLAIKEYLRNDSYYLKFKK